MDKTEEKNSSHRLIKSIENCLDSSNINLDQGQVCICIVLSFLERWFTWNILPLKQFPFRNLNG